MTPIFLTAGACTVLAVGQWRWHLVLCALGRFSYSGLLDRVGQAAAIVTQRCAELGFHVLLQARRALHPLSKARSPLSKARSPPAFAVLAQSTTRLTPGGPRTAHA